MDSLEYLKKVVDPFPRKMHIHTKFSTLFWEFIGALSCPKAHHESLFTAVISKMGCAEVHAPQGVCKMIHWIINFLFVFICCL